MEIERGDQNVSKGFFRSVVLAYLDKPAAAPPCPADTAATRPVENPYYRQTFMLQLSELERMNNFSECIGAIREYAERFPDAPENGVLALRALEYRRLLGETVTAADYQPFLDGKSGPQAAEQAKLISWFYEKPNHALVGMNANGRSRVFLDGKPLLEGDHPYNLFVTGVELSDGPHALCAETTMLRQDPWTLLGVLMQNGFAGTCVGTKTTLKPGSNWNMPEGDTTAWGFANSQNIARGTPDAPMIGGIPNAFVLLPSKAYSIGAQDWAYFKGKANYRVDFTTPLHGMPDYTPQMTGLSH